MTDFNIIYKKLNKYICSRALSNVLLGSLYMFLFFSCEYGLLAQTTTFSGVGNWSAAARWSNGIPTEDYDVIIANNSRATIDDLASPASCKSITFASNGNNTSSITIANSNSLTVFGDIVFSEPSHNNGKQLIDVGAGTLECENIFMDDTKHDNGDIRIRVSTGIVNVSGNITMNGSEQRNFFECTSNCTFNVDGNFGSGNFGRVDLSSGSIYAYGDFIVNTFNCNTGTLRVGNRFIPSSFNRGTGTINYFGTSSQNIRNVDYFNLITSTSGIKTLLGNITVHNNILVADASTLADGGFTITGFAARTFTIESGASYTTTRTATPWFPTNATPEFDNNSTVNINGDASFTLSGIPTSYGHLSFGGATAARTKTLPAATPITANGNLTISTNNTLADAGNTITVKKNLISNGAHSGTGKIYFNDGTALRSISGTGSINNFEIDDALNASLSSNFRMTGQFTFTEGLLYLNSYDLVLETLATTAGTPSASSMVVTNGSGQLIKRFDAGAESFTFPIGEVVGTTEYSPVTIDFGSKDAGSVGANVVDAKHPSVPMPDYITRYWNFTTLDLGVYEYEASLNYVLADFVDDEYTESDLLAKFYISGVWKTDASSTANDVAHSITTSSLSSADFPLNNTQITAFVGFDKNSILTDGPFSEPTSILYSVNALADRVTVLDFKLIDAGTSDETPTVIEEIIFTPGTDNDIADWRDAIAGARLFGPDGEFIGIVGATSITFAGPSMISVADSSIETYQLRIWLNADLTSINDCDKLDFAISSLDITTADISSVFDTFLVESGPIVILRERDSTSAILAGDGVQPTSISSILNVFDDRFNVFQVKFADSATADNLPTIINKLIFTQGATNEIADWTDAIAGARLFGTDGEFTGTVKSDSIIFSAADMITIEDGTDDTYELRIWLKTDLSAISDNDKFDFKLDHQNIYTNACGSSHFVDAIIESGSVAIDIQASKIVFVANKPPAFSLIYTDFEVEIYAVDINDNIDTDYSAQVVLSLNAGAGTLSSATGLTQNFVNGIYEWTDVQYDTPELATIKASSIGIDEVISNTINFVSELTLISAGAGAEPSEISSLIDTEGERILVFDFTITDEGSADLLPTIINEIIITQGSKNQIADWTDAIAGATLFGPDGEFIGVVGATSITFAGASMIEVDDGDNETYQLRIWLNTDLSAINDNDTLDFKIIYTNVETEPLISSIIGICSVESGGIAIDIEATELMFAINQPPAFVALNSNFTVTVYAIDENGNIDLDAIDEITLSRETGTGILSSATGLVQNLVSGAYTWTDVKYDTEEEFYIEAATPAIDDVVSIAIQCVLNRDSKVEVGAAGEPASISSTVDDYASRIMVFDVKFVDLGTSDGLPTIIEEIVFTQGVDNDVADWRNAIAGATLYGPDLGQSTGSELSGIVNETDISFTLATPISVADGTDETYQLRIFLLKNLSSITDNDNLDFELDYTNIQTAAIGSSEFGEGAPVSGPIAIDIEATKLVFTNLKPAPIVGKNIDFFVRITAIDDNGNIDLDANEEIVIARGDKGTISIESETGLTQNLSNGVYEWTDVKYDKEELFNISATYDGGAITATSIDIICADCFSSAIYSDGDILGGKQFGTGATETSSCPGTLTVNIPFGATIVRVDIKYEMISSAGTQTSQIRCIGGGNTPKYTDVDGVDVGGGRVRYIFNNLDIANAITDVNSINFEMHAGRSNAAGGADCRDAAYVINNTWEVYVYYVTTGVHWTGTESSAWHNSDNWTCGIIPTRYTDMIIPAGTPNNPVISNGDAEVRSITISAGASLTIQDDRTLEVRGDFNNEGTFNSGVGTETVAFRDVSIITSNGDAFNNVVLNGTSATLDDNISINGDFTITAGTWDVSASNYSMNVGGNWTNNGTFTHNNGTVQFVGENIQTLSDGVSITFGSIVVNKSAGDILYAPGTTTMNVSDYTNAQGNFTSPQTFNITGSVTLTSGTFTGGTTVNVGSNWLVNGGIFDGVTNSTTTRFTGGLAQSIQGSQTTASFYNIENAKSAGTLSVGGSVNTINCNNYTNTSGNFTVPATFNLSGNLTINANTVTLGTNMFLAGNLTYNAGTLTIPVGTTITFNGTSPQVLGGTIASYPTFQNITLNSSESTAALTLNKPISINGVLTLTDGHIVTSADNILTMTEDASVVLNAPVSQDNSFVKGPMHHTIASTAPETRLFPVGKDNVFHRLDLLITQAATTSTLYTCEYLAISAEALGWTMPASLNRVSQKGLWDVTKGIGADVSDGNVRLYYSEWDGVDDAPNLRIAKQISPTDWADIGGVGTSAPSGSILSTSPFTSFSYFALANEAEAENNPLPVELTVFTVQTKEKSVQLNWTTLSEIYSDYFAIERSKNGVDFDEILQVNAKGFSSNISNYTAFDEYPFTGRSYYRLRMVDIDGQYEYSNIQTVFFTIQNSELVINLYPNPAGTTDNVVFSITGLDSQSEILVVVQDIIGKELYSKVVLTDYNGQMIEAIDPYNKLAPGIYMVIGSSNNYLYKRKLIIKD